MIESSHRHQHVDHFSQSFALQYISLILFIMIFSVGAFLPKKFAPHVSTVVHTLRLPVDEEITEAAPVELAKFEVKELFQPASSDLNEAGWDGFRSILSTHDINFSLDIVWGKAIGLSTALSRADNVIAYLEEQRIPRSAIRIALVRSESESEGTVTLTKAVPHE